MADLKKSNLMFLRFNCSSIISFFQRKEHINRTHTYIASSHQLAFIQIYEIIIMILRWPQASKPSTRSKIIGRLDTVYNHSSETLRKDCNIANSTVCLTSTLHLSFGVAVGGGKSLVSAIPIRTPRHVYVINGCETDVSMCQVTLA